jgi:LysR family hydrogen peroxide-inducible transcriptional activator
VLAEAAVISDLSRRMPTPLVGPLILRVIPTLTPYLPPWLVPLLRVSYPNLRLVLQHRQRRDRCIEDAIG